MAIRVDIEALGDGQFVEIKEPKFLSWGLQKQITTIVLSDVSSSSQLDVAEMVAIAIIKSGNIEDEDGALLVLPIDGRDCQNLSICCD